MRDIGPLALIAWFPITLLIFRVLGLQRGLVAAVFAGTMFLPVDEIELSGFFDLTKGNVIALSAVLALFLTDGRRALAFRPSAWDLPMLAVCVLPIVSTLNNNGTVYSAFSVSAQYFLRVGAMYFAGRVVLGDASGRRELTTGFIVAVVAYAPFCLFEVRMSPCLHLMVYGFHQHQFAQTIRGGGFRPMVFMDHGLMVGLWMSVGTLLLLVLAFARSVRSVLHMPVVWVVGGLMATVALCKSTGAIGLFLAGVAIVGEWVATKRRTIAWILAVLPGLYVAARVLQLWNGRDMVTWAATLSADRAQSIEFRLDSEEQLIGTMGNRLWFGKGPTGFNYIANDDGTLSWVIGDSLWINTLTAFGVASVIALWVAFAIPFVVAMRHVPAAQFFSRANAPIAALSLVILLFQVDCVFNAFPAGPYFLVMGSLVGLSQTAAART